MRTHEREFLREISGRLLSLLETDELNELFEASKSKQLTARISELEAQVHDEDKFPSGSVLDEKSKAVLMSDVLAKGKYVRLLEHVVASYGREHSN